jgi:hypothetical protein
VNAMTETVLNTKTLPEALSKLIRTEKVKVRETDGEIHLIPIQESIDYISKLRGSLANHTEMSVDKFFFFFYADKELEE